MKYLLRSLQILVFLCLGVCEIYAQEEIDFVGDWYFIGGENHFYPELNKKIINSKEIEIRLRISNNSNIQLIENDEIINQAYLNGDYRIVTRYDSGILKGKISIQNDTLVIRSKNRLCPAWDYSIYFKKYIDNF